MVTNKYQLPTKEQDGYWFEDVEQMNRKYPETFELPPAVRRYNLRPGETVKLMFNLLFSDEIFPKCGGCHRKKPKLQEGCERMWVLVKEVHGERYIGVLDNQPVFRPDLKACKTEVCFEARHVIDIWEEKDK